MILRAVKDSRWSAINNTVLNDERLSWRARGIAAYLLTKPDNWRIDHTHLWRVGKEGRDAVLAAMKELEICGYLVRKRYQKSDGKFATEVQLHETPQPKSENQETDFQEVDSPQPNTDFQEPTTENQESVNQKSVSQDSLLILKPITESKGDEDDPRAGDAVEAAWLKIYGTYMPEHILQPMNRLLTKCSEAAIVHAINVSVGAESRSFRYIAECARNYLPPAPASNGNSKYSVELEPRPDRPSPPTRHSPLPALPADPNDPWVVTMDEIRRSGQIDMRDIEGSRLEIISHIGRDCLCRVHLAADADGDYVQQHLRKLIGRTLSSILRARVEVEIVAAEPEKKLSPLGQAERIEGGKL